jgi:act minimal PKS acyl carrier protein
VNDFTLEDLKSYLRAAVGDDESVSLDDDIIDTAFSDLGFDSLALIDTVSKIEQRNGVSLPEDEAALAATPRELLDLIRDALGQRSVV